MPLGEQGADRIYLGYAPREILTVLQKERGRSLTKEELNGFFNVAAAELLDYVVFPVDVRDLEFEVDVPDSGTDVFVRQRHIGTWVAACVTTTGTAYPFRPATGSDLVVSSSTWSWNVVFALSPWLVPDNPMLSPEHATFCEHVLQQQLSWASHCTVYAALLPTPAVTLTSKGTAVWAYERYAAWLARTVDSYIATRLWVRIPLIVSYTSEMTRAVDYLDGWCAWNHIRNVVGSPYIGVVLELTNDCPSDPALLERWIAEPIQALLIPAKVFRTSGTAVALPKVYKHFLMRLLRQNCHVILESPVDHATLQAVRDMTSTVVYSKDTTVRDLVGCIAKIHAGLPKRTDAEEFELPCLDKLQAPLQPLRDNLESQTYETFEKDPVKYERYEAAILACLEDRVASGHSSHVLTVVGAGRGPLVAAALRALRRAKISPSAYHLTAVEKNQNAVITLTSRVQDDPDPAWRDVEVVEGDMRSYLPKRKTNILVSRPRRLTQVRRRQISELLGSFGDNELSPECLDGAQRFLAEDAVSIPCYYFSSLEPVSTPKLWSECHMKGADATGLVKALESLHVVKLHSVYYLAKERAQKCFEFSHPCRRPFLPHNAHNARSAEIAFTAKTDSVCHGFACYFHCTLYESITISIHPETFSEGMISWFPIFMPLKRPVFVNANDTLRLHVWRRCNDRQVWYEWLVSAPTTQELHNTNGRSQTILM